MQGPWTKIEHDPTITEEEGKAFFGRLRRFQEILRRLERPKGSVRTRRDLEDAFMRIGELRPFIYKVRCNIFHGRKSLVEAVEKNQNKRIEVYFLFLKGLVTLFFGVFKGFPACRDRRRI